jgi:hypothetical protein
MLEKFGADSLDQMRAAYEAHQRWVHAGPQGARPQ